jgi:hypothetical protein
MTIPGGRGSEIEMLTISLFKPRWPRGKLPLACQDMLTSLVYLHDLGGSLSGQESPEFAVQNRVESAGATHHESNPVLRSDRRNELLQS